VSGATDEELFRACADEQRVLVTLDLDFATPLRFDPVGASGIAVLRVPDLPGLPSIIACVRRLAAQLDAADIAGRLWIVDPKRVRQYEPAEQPRAGQAPVVRSLGSTPLSGLARRFSHVLRGLDTLALARKRARVRPRRG